MKSSSTFRKYALLILVSFIWGAQFSLNKIVLITFSPLWVAFFRVALGTLTLMSVLLCVKHQRIEYRTKDIFFFMLIGLLESVLPLNLMLWGQQQVPSSMTGMLISIVPIWVVVISFLLQPKKTNWVDICSVLIGFIGVLALLMDDKGLTTDFHWLRALSLIGAALSFAMAILLIDRTLSRFPPLIATRNILMSASLALLVMLLLSDQLESIRSVSIDTKTLLAMLVVGVVCTGFVWLAYTQLIRTAGPTFTSMANYLTPMVSVFLGFIMFGEAIAWRHLVGLMLIIGALVFRQVLVKEKVA